MLAQPARRVVTPARPVRPAASARPAAGPLRRSYGLQWGGGWGGWMYTNVYDGPDELDEFRASRLSPDAGSELAERQRRFGMMMKPFQI